LFAESNCDATVVLVTSKNIDNLETVGNVDVPDGVTADNAVITVETHNNVSRVIMQPPYRRLLSSHLQCESKKVAPLKLFVIFSLVVNLCN